jgi:hypothetical protein
MIKESKDTEESHSFNTYNLCMIARFGGYEDRHPSDDFIREKGDENIPYEVIR